MTPSEKTPTARGRSIDPLASKKMDGLRESLRSVKNDVKGVAKAGKTWVKDNVAAPVLGLLGLSEGAKRRKGQVEEFFNDIQGDDLHSLSQLLENNLCAERSNVDIVDINSELNARRRSASGPRDHPGPRTVAPEDKPDSWIKRMAKKNSIFARCTNKEVREVVGVYELPWSEQSSRPSCTHPFCLEGQWVGLANVEPISTRQRNRTICHPDAV